MPQKIAILYNVTLQTSHKQYQNNVRKYLRPYTDTSLPKLMEKIIWFMSRSLGTKFFFSLAHGQNANCTFLFLYVFDGSADTVAM